jgi:hypothetical protein
MPSINPAVYQSNNHHHHLNSETEYEPMLAHQDDDDDDDETVQLSIVIWNQSSLIQLKSET